MSLRLLAAACVLVPGLGLAAELGRLTLLSGVGEPLRAEIEVLAVKPGETLAAIAQGQRLDGATLDQAIVAIYQANEQAFLDANLNRLRVGQRLAIPGADAMRAIDPAEARRTVLAHGAAHARAATAAEPAPKAEPDRFSVSRAEPKPGGKVTATAREDDLASVQRALVEARERIGLLERNLDDVRALLALKDQQLARMHRHALPAPLAGDAAAAGESSDARDAEGALTRLLSHYGGWLVLGFVIGFASWVTMPLKSVRLWRKKRRRRQHDLRKHARRVRRAAKKAGLLSTAS